ncbi:MAG: PbsX family transcriptional regulator [Ramlibacter sp.]|nr:PbsX family transcriptional regulator [Ramlibacter sp.]
MTTVTIKSEETIQQWGNGLAVRIAAPIARAARLAQGTSVTLEVVDEGVLVRMTGSARLTLAEKLRAFDPATHVNETAAFIRSA